MNQLKVIIVLMFTLFAWKAYSQFEIEPYVGYELNSFDHAAPASSDSDGKQLVFGGRLGYSIIPFISLGADVSIGSGDAELDSNGSEYDISSTEIGAYVKFTSPLLFQAYAGYIVSADLEEDFGGAGSNDYSGDGIKLGVGWTGFPFVVVNFEYKMISYDELETSTGTSNADFDNDSYGINISLPLNL